jgi:hypothetical protein
LGDNIQHPGKSPLAKSLCTNGSFPNMGRVRFTVVEVVVLSMVIEFAHIKAGAFENKYSRNTKIMLELGSVMSNFLKIMAARYFKLSKLDVD